MPVCTQTSPADYVLRLLEESEFRDETVERAYPS